MVLFRGKVVVDIEAARSVKKEWWDANFKMVKPCSPNMVSRKRKVWVKLWGVPLHVWDDKFFKHIEKIDFQIIHNVECQISHNPQEGR